MLAGSVLSSNPFFKHFSTIEAYISKMLLLLKILCTCSRGEFCIPDPRTGKRLTIRKGSQPDDWDEIEVGSCIFADG